MSNKSIERTIILKGTEKAFSKLEALLALAELEIVEVEAETTKAEVKATKATTTEYALPYTVDGTKVTIGNADGSYLHAKVFNAVKYCIKQNGGQWDKDAKVWKFKTKKAVEAFEKAWKDGKPKK